ncbi:MAG: peptidylprolyl isomerase [Ruminococcus sp.]|nr:peptidylprolyl isomerase [Ruminococcus sp.]
MKSMLKNYAAKAVCLMCAVVIASMGMMFTGCGNKTTSTSSSTTTQPATKATEGEVNPDDYKDFKAVIDVVNYGKIELEFEPESAPITVANFVKLADEGFYDGLTFHRIMEGFMIQGGDPLGNGTGGSDENIKGEFSDNGVDNKLSHTRGAVSMARSNDPDSASSQFFIVHQDSTFLDGSYAVFGYVTSGMDVVDRIAADSKPIDNNGTIRTSEQPVISSVTIIKPSTADEG